MIISFLYKDSECALSAGDILAYISSLSLGVLALWQSQKSQEEDKENKQNELAIENYPLFEFNNLKLSTYDIITHNDKYHEMTNIKEGLNGLQAAWNINYHLKNDMIQLTMNIKNIGKIAATNLYISDKYFNKVDNTNVKTSENGDNNKKHILVNNIGKIYINFRITELKNNDLVFYLVFQNIFQSKYYQKIIVSQKIDNKIITVDTECLLNIISNI